MFLSLDTIPGLKGQVSAPEEKCQGKTRIFRCFRDLRCKEHGAQPRKSQHFQIFFFEATYQFPKDRHFHPF